MLRNNITISTLQLHRRQFLFLLFFIFSSTLLIIILQIKLYTISQKAVVFINFIQVFTNSLAVSKNCYKCGLFSIYYPEICFSEITKYSLIIKYYDFINSITYESTYNSFHLRQNNFISQPISWVKNIDHTVTSKNLNNTIAPTPRTNNVNNTVSIVQNNLSNIFLQNNSPSAKKIPESANSDNYYPILKPLVDSVSNFNSLNHPASPYMTPRFNNYTSAIQEGRERLATVISNKRVVFDSKTHLPIKNKIIQASFRVERDELVRAIVNDFIYSQYSPSYDISTAHGPVSLRIRDAESKFVAFCKEADHLKIISSSEAIPSSLESAAEQLLIEYRKAIYNGEFDYAIRSSNLEYVLSSDILTGYACRRSGVYSKGAIGHGLWEISDFRADIYVDPVTYFENIGWF